MRRFLALLTLLPLFAFAGAPLFAEDEPKPADKDEAAQPPEKPSDEEIAQMAALVKELRAITADIRGLEWKQPVESFLLTRTQVRKRMTEQIKKDMEPEKLEKMTRIVHRLRFLPEDKDPLSMALDMISSMAGGFYDPEEKKLYMVAGQDPATLKPIIVHELLHALEDQYIDLKAKHEEFEENSDGMFAFKCMVEGSAEMCRWIFEERDPEAAAAYVAGAKTNSEAQQAQMKTMRTIPAWMMIDTLLHYRTGPNFVAAALGDDYKGKIDALYGDGPTTQEQVLHPDRWLGEKKDLPQIVKWSQPLHEVLGKGWTELDNSTSGELDLAVMLDFYLGKDGGRLDGRDMARGTMVASDAREAAMGWDGGRTTFLDFGGEHLGLASTYVFDTEEDAKEAMNAFKIAATKLGGDAHVAADARAQEFGASAWKQSGSEALDQWHYRNDFGLGVLARRADQLFWLDGFTLEELMQLVPAVSATRGVRQAGDTWTPTVAADPFEGCDIVDRVRGIGIKFPNDTWSLNEGMTKQAAMDPSVVGFYQKEGTNFAVMVGVAAQGASKGQLVPMMKQFLEPSGLAVDEAKIEELLVAGQKGVSYAPVNMPAMTMRLGLASDGLRMFIIMMRGNGEEMKTHAEEIQALLDGIVTVLPY